MHFIPPIHRIHHVPTSRITLIIDAPEKNISLFSHPISFQFVCILLCATKLLFVADMTSISTHRQNHRTRHVVRLQTHSHYAIERRAHRERTFGVRKMCRRHRTSRRKRRILGWRLDGRGKLAPRCRQSRDTAACSRRPTRSMELYRSVCLCTALKQLPEHCVAAVRDIMQHARWASYRIWVLRVCG